MHDRQGDVKQYLESLGEPPLPDGLWQRVDGARRQRMRRRAGVAMASVAAVALGFALMMPGVAPDADTGPQLAGRDAGEAEAQAVAGIDEETIRTVYAIDRALQAAYDRNAGDDEIEPLWRARHALLHTSGPLTRSTEG